MSVIAIATIGTLGDLFPFFQLGSELKKRGHPIIFATSKLYQPQVEELGFTFFPCGPIWPILALAFLKWANR